MNLYHFVPKNLHKDKLYPLNILKSENPELHRVAMKKYEGRESTIKNRIPQLGTWADVIHLSPIDPKEVKEELAAANIPVNWEWKVYVIDPKSLDAEKLKIMTVTFVNRQVKRSYHDFSIANLKKFCHLPEHTKQHYRESAAKGEQPFIFGGAPHVFYKGTIDINGLPVKTFSI